MWCFFYGRECKDFKSEEDRFNAGYECGLSDGAYGRNRDDKEGPFEYDDLAVVCYINSTAALKEYSDVCVTSANAVKIVKELPQKNIFFIPDRNLAHYVASQVPEKNFVYNNGFCPTHERIEAEDVANVKAQHPDAQIVAHGECQSPFS